MLNYRIFHRAIGLNVSIGNIPHNTCHIDFLMGERRCSKPLRYKNRYPWYWTAPGTVPWRHDMKNKMGFAFFIVCVLFLSSQLTLGHAGINTDADLIVIPGGFSYATRSAHLESSTSSSVVGESLFSVPLGFSVIEASWSALTSRPAPVQIQVKERKHKRRWF